MSDTTLSPDLARQLDDLRAAGHRVFGPGPMTPGQTTPTADAQVTTPGMHVQIGDASGQLIEGVGATADDAARDALTKLGADPAHPAA
jgi:hypothetical protein